MDDRPEFESAHPSYPRSYAEGEEHPAHHAEPRRVGGGRVLLAAVLGGIIGAALVGGGLYLGLLPSGTAPVSRSVVVSRLATQPLETAAAKALPSVVNVAVELPLASGVGSGVIIRSSGYILTNNHVVDGASRITVRLGTTDYPAHVIGTDPTSDLAVIKIEKTGLPVAVLGDSSTLQVGETVLAVGSPFGLDKTVTSGIISALHRSNLGSNGVTAYTDLIQTDAAINPGNSGGALVDLNGEVVGINALIESPSGELGAGQSAGIGFAIPVDFARVIADQIVSGKPVLHPYLGVSLVTVTPEFAQANGLSASSGALVQQVTAGSPAAAAGIKVGDIIVKVDGSDTISSDDVFAAVQGSAIGTPIAIVVVRNGADLTLHATLIQK